MISNYGYIDGSWKLKVVSEDLNGVVILTVYNHTVLGEVYNRIAQHFNIDKNQMRYFCFWCPLKNLWLMKTELTLHQLCLNANTILFYTKKFKEINIQFTNKINQKITVDFSIQSLNVIKYICGALGIDNFHIYSLMKYRRNHEIFNSTKPKTIFKKLAKSPITSSLKNIAFNSSNNKRISKNLGSNFPWTPTSGYGSLSSTINSLENYHGSCLSINNQINHNNDYLNNNNIGKLLNDSNFPMNSNTNHHLKNKNNNDRSKQNKEWILFSKSLMEQNLSENCLLQLKIRSLTLNFDDKSISNDLLDLYYEQYKDFILSGEIEIEINLALILAALQYNIFLIEKESRESKANIMSCSKYNFPLSLDEEINNILLELEKELLINSDEIDSSRKYTFRIDYFVNVHQIIPVKSTGKLIRMKLKLIKDHIKIFKENNFSNPKYEFSIKNCKFFTSFGNNSDENFISWLFEFNKKLIKIETKFFNDADFIALYLSSVLHSNYWRPTFKQYSECEKVVENLVDIFHSKDEPIYNIFNMPRVELIDLLGCRIGKKESSGKYLKEILKYQCSFKGFSIRQSKIQYLKFCMNIPRYNYHYFSVQIHDPVEITGSTIVAINEEMFFILDPIHHSITRYALPWTILKSWKFNTELNTLELYFQNLLISFTTIDCSSTCFHEFVSTFIWFASTDKTVDKTEKWNELINLINIKT